MSTLKAKEPDLEVSDEFMGRGQTFIIIQQKNT